VLFKKKHVKLILEGRKTATRRLTGRYKLGRVYAVQGWLYDRARGYILIVKKYRQKLGDMSEEDIRKEGCSSREEFIREWEESYGPGSYQPDLEVWVYEFKLIRGDFIRRRGAQTKRRSEKK